MQYFTHLVRYNMPANKLQREALEVLKCESNYLIDGDTGFIERLRRKVERLNVENPRCKPLEVYVFKSGSRNDSIGISLGVYFTVSFTLYRVKGQEAI